MKKIKPGIKLHTIKTEKFKTNLIAIFLSMPITRENVTKNALISSILRRGSMNMPTLLDISKKLEEMYGASFDCGIEKTGDNHIFKFYLESINEEFLPEKEEIAQKCLEILFDIVFNPLIEGDKFKEEYVQGEKENIKQIIQSKIDNKSKYALDRCIEEMFKDQAYGLYKYGYVEDLEKITPQSLYEYYKKLINNCKIDIFCSGIIESKHIENIVYSGLVPQTSKEAVDAASFALKNKQESTTTNEEILQMISDNLQV